MMVYWSIAFLKVGKQWTWRRHRGMGLLDCWCNDTNNAWRLVHDPPHAPDWTHTWQTKKMGQKPMIFHWKKNFSVFGAGIPPYPHSGVLDRVVKIHFLGPTSLNFGWRRSFFHCAYYNQSPRQPVERSKATTLINWTLNTTFLQCWLQNPLIKSFWWMDNTSSDFEIFQVVRS